MWLSILLILPGAVALGQTPPEKFFGFAVGADRNLVDYVQLQAYFERLAQESPRLKLVDLGPTTLKKPLVMAVITSQNNMAELDRYRAISKRLRDARTLSPSEAAQLARQGKGIVVISCSIHSTEIGASQMAPELAYKLVTGQTPFDAAQVLNDVIVLLVPSSNPDGLQMVTEWYRKYVNTPYEGGRMPWLYHHYAGHDNNRDFYMFNFPETRALNKVTYHDWIPQVYLAMHQMGSFGPRLSLQPPPPPPAPLLPNVQPLQWSMMAFLDSQIAYDLEKAGFQGVNYREGYGGTGWWCGAEDDVAWPRNVIGLFSEMASGNLATPIYIEPDEIPAQFRRTRTNLIYPWPGGWWRLRDIVDYDLAITLSLIKTIALHKEDILYSFYRMNRDSIEGKGLTDGLFAYIVPPDQHDYLTAVKMVDVVMMGGVEVHQAEEGFLADGKSYPAGSFVVLMGQPYRPYVQTLLGRQRYPDGHEGIGGLIVPPYDNAGWTLPLQMGVTIDAVRQPFSAKLKRITEAPYPTGTVPAGSPAYLVLDGSLNAAYGVAAGLVNARVEVSRAMQPLTAGGRTLPPGAFVVKNDPIAQKQVPALLERWHYSPSALQTVTGVKLVPLKTPRIGLYESYMGAVDEGWTRFVLDDFGIPFVTLRNKDLRERQREPLKSKVDVLILASEARELIIDGRPRPGSPAAQRFSPLPPEFAGGIGREGVDAIKSFVEDDGGTLVTLGEACRFAFSEFDIPVRDTVEGLDRSSFFCPTSLVRIKVDPETPLGFGMPSEATAMFANSVVMETWMPQGGDRDRRVVASFPEDRILASGLLLGEDRMARKAAVVDVTYGKGRVILLGIRPQFRGQSHGTYKFLLNSLFSSVEQAGTRPTAR